MSKRIYLTYDIGTTALKTALISELGEVLAINTSEYSFESPYPDWAEADPDVYWNALLCGTRAVLEKSKAEVSEIAAIGLCSQGQTFVPIDSHGRPLHDAVIWLDQRAYGVASEWQSDWLDRDYFRKISGYPWVPGDLTVFKIAWLLKHEPELKSTWKYLCIPDYLIFRLSGATATDQTIATMTGMYDLESMDWDSRMLEAAGVDRSQLPTVLHSGSVAGELTKEAASALGIKPGTPICVGCNDQIAGAVGVANVRPGVVSETTGTALAVVTTTNERTQNIHTCIGRHAAQDRYYSMCFANASAIVLKWFRDLCTCGETYDQFLAGIEEIKPGCDGLTVLPHFCGTQSHPDLRGAIVGLSLSHTRAHMSRAIMESCCCLLKQCLDVIISDGSNISSVRSLGGAAKSDLWLQMKADMLGIEVERPACSNAASLGAAMLAAWGVGQFDSIEEASNSWYRPERIFMPNPGSYAIYQDVYQRYLSLESILSKNGEI